MSACSSFNHLIGPEQQRLGNRDADRLRCLEVDHEGKLCRLLDGEVSRLRTFQDSIHVVRRAPVDGGKACPVGEEPSGLNKVLVQRDHRQQVISLYKDRSEEHTSELQSRPHLVCRLLLEKKKKKKSS